MMPLSPTPTSANASYKVDVVPLHLALPGRSVRPVGLLLLDVEADDLYCKIEQVTDDEDAAEILGCLAEHFVTMSKERGGRVVVDYLQESLSNVLQTGDREQLFVLNHPALAVEQLFSERTASRQASVKTWPLAHKVLVVEDNPADVWIIKEALREYSSATVVTVATDGEEAIQLLKTFRTALSGPDLVLLDLNLPKRSGHEVLQSLRANPSMRLTPVAIFTSSSLPEDMKNAHDEGASCYVQKPHDLIAFNASLSALCSRFFAAAA